MARNVVRWVFRPWRTLKDGTRLYAKNYGKKAWRIPVYEDEVVMQ